MTDAGGNYEFPTVRPGTYRVKSGAEGISDLRTERIVLAVEDRLRVDPVMQVGETSPVVTVEVRPLPCRPKARRWAQWSITRRSSRFR